MQVNLQQTAVVDQGSLAVIINKYNYPTFSAYQFPSQFIIGEQLVSNQIVRDFYITSTETDAKNPDIIKVAGTYELSPGEIIVGKESGTVANIVSITENEGSWRERQLARKEERMRVRREAAEKAKATLEGRGTGTPARKKDGRSNPEYMVDYRQKQKDEGLMGETDPNSVWANLERGVQIRSDQMGKNHAHQDYYLHEVSFP